MRETETSLGPLYTQCLSDLQAMFESAWMSTPVRPPDTPSQHAVLMQNTQADGTQMRFGGKDANALRVPRARKVRARQLMQKHPGAVC